MNKFHKSIREKLQEEYYNGKFELKKYMTREEKCDILMTAADEGNIEVVKDILSNKRYKLDLYCDIAFYFSIKNKHFEISKVLLSDERVKANYRTNETKIINTILECNDSDLFFKIFEKEEFTKKINKEEYEILNNIVVKSRIKQF